MIDWANQMIMEIDIWRFAVFVRESPHIIEPIFMEYILVVL